MKKILLSVFLVFAVLCTALNVIGGEPLFNITEYDFEVYRHGEKMNFDSPILLVDGRTYVPLRSFAEEMNHSVEWFEDEKTITLTDNSLDIYAIFEKLMFKLPETADISDYAYAQEGRDESITVAVTFKESDLSYIQKELEEYTHLLTKEEQENKSDMLKGMKRYPWWNTSIGEADYVYFGFEEGIEASTIPIYALIDRTTYGNYTYYTLYLTR